MVSTNECNCRRGRGDVLECPTCLHICIVEDTEAVPKFYSNIVMIKSREPRIIDFAAGGERYLVSEIISICSRPLLTVSHTLIRFHRVYSMEEAVTYLVISIRI